MGIVEEDVARDRRDVAAPLNWVAVVTEWGIRDPLALGSSNGGAVMAMHGAAGQR